MHEIKLLLVLFLVLRSFSLSSLFSLFLRNQLFQVPIQQKGADTLKWVPKSPRVVHVLYMSTRHKYYCSRTCVNQEN